MGKVLVIKGANFASVAVATIDIEDPIDLEEYVNAEQSVSNPVLVDALLTTNNEVLYAVDSHGGIIDNTALVGNTTVGDGTKVADIIAAYADSL